MDKVALPPAEDRAALFGQASAGHRDRGGGRPHTGISYGR